MVHAPSHAKTHQEQRVCPTCARPVVGHPNKRFCRPVCKDRYHNAQPHRADRTRQYDPRPAHYCDECAERGEQIRATKSGASITHRGGRVFLCDVHAMEWVHPFSDEAVQGAF